MMEVYGLIWYSLAYQMLVWYGIIYLFGTSTVLLGIANLELYSFFFFFFALVIVALVDFTLR